MTVVVNVFVFKEAPGEIAGEGLARYQYYETVTALVELNIEFYVDLFLLWLLYRFMKP